MNYRTAAYFNRKKAMKSLPLATSLKGLLKAGFFASGSLLVKRDILKLYSDLYSAKAS